jgi:hypothetical protein
LPKEIELQLPGGDRLVVPLSAPVQNCDKKRWQATPKYRVYPGWLSESTVSSYDLRSSVPLRASLVTKGLPKIRIRGKDKISHVYIQVKRGETFRFRVALRNPTKHPVRFKSCPLYSEYFSAGPHDPYANVPEVYVLNCEPAGVIAPGKSATFAMRAHVSENATLGSNSFYWQTYSKRGPYFVQDVWVTN